MIRILIVEGQPAAGDGLRLLLERRPDQEVVGVASSVEQATELFRRLSPDVTLADMRMRDGSGRSVLDAILGEAPAARVIALTAFDSDEEIGRSIRAGAHGSLLASASGEVLARTIQRVAAGRDIG